MSSMPSFKDMPIWQRSMRFASEIYQLTAQLPATERLGVSNSLQQAAVALPTVLASGSLTGRDGFRSACLRGRQSAAEAETLLIIISQAYPAVPVDDLLAEVNDLQTALIGMAQRLNKQPPKSV